MQAKWIFAVCCVIATSSLVQAGGPPPMYVVVHKVVIDRQSPSPSWVQIWGCISRVENGTDAKGQRKHGYSKPVYGYVYLSAPSKTVREFNEELKDWQNAAGTGKAVAIGSCGVAGCMLKCPIHSPDEVIAKPDDTYTVGHLRAFGDLYANDAFNQQPEVAALLKFAKERK